MKQRALQKHIRKQGARLDKSIMKVVHTGYRTSNPTMEIRGLGTNELKAKLIKQGYDIYCPNCQHHYSMGSLDNYILRCPRCHYAWKVGFNGRPNTIHAGALKEVSK